MEHSPSFLTAVLGLIFVLGIILAVSLIIRKLGAPFLIGKKIGEKPELNIKEIRAIDVKNKLVLFNFRNKDYLIYSGDHPFIIDSFESKNITPSQEFEKVLQDTKHE